MKLSRCPTCHGNIHLDTLIQDNSAKALLASVVKLPANLAANMVGYIGLFRPEKSDLNNERASRLINEVLALTNNQTALLTALEQTVIQIQTKRKQGVSQPLKNHSYLIKVLETVADNHKHPMANVKQSSTPGFEIKQQGAQETPEQNQAAFETLHNKYKG